MVLMRFKPAFVHKKPRRHLLRQLPEVGLLLNNGRLYFGHKNCFERFKLGNARAGHLPRITITYVGNIHT